MGQARMVSVLLGPARMASVLLGLARMDSVLLGIARMDSVLLGLNKNVLSAPSVIFSLKEFFVEKLTGWSIIAKIFHYLQKIVGLFKLKHHHFQLNLSIKIEKHYFESSKLYLNIESD